MNMSKLLRWAGASLLIGLAGPSWAAGNFPAQPIRMVVPFPPGTATDMAARLVADKLQNSLQQPVVVANKPGAGGSIGAMEVVRAEPDGYTIMFASNSAVASNVALLKNIPYDPNQDFTPIVGTGVNALVLMVKPEFPAKDLKEFIEYVKQRPGKLNAGYGSSSSQVNISLLGQMAGLDVLSVPYKGIPLAVNDVLGGELDFTFVDIGNAMAQAEGGKLRAIAVSSEDRNPLVPDWPTLSEELPGYDITAWFAMVGPAGMPADVVDVLYKATAEALKDPELVKKLGTAGITAKVTPPQELKPFIAAQIEKWKKLVADAGIEPR